MIQAVFRIEAADRAATVAHEGSAEAETLTVTYYANGSTGYWVQPIPQPDLLPRRTLANALEVVDRAAVEASIRGADEDERRRLVEDFREGLAGAIHVLRGSASQIAEADRRRISSVVDRIQATGQVAAQDLVALAREALRSLESTRHQRLGQALLDRVPRALIFSTEDRELRGIYSTADLPETPSALENLLALAGTTPKELRTVIESRDAGRIESWTVRANDRLEAAMSTWTQAGVKVRLRIDLPSDGDGTISVLTWGGGGEFIGIEQRSTGLQVFVALTAFVRRHSADSDILPILLIDEAEQHLHYSAQADLIRVLEGQDVAAQVIYTTHSAGCLPSDIGMGVRVCQPSEAGAEIENRFWRLGFGLSALMTAMGMGVAALALTPARYAVITEGVSDFAILPTLLREATGREVPFQTVPNLAKVNLADFPDLNLEAARVAFLLDGDDEGTLIGKQLVEAGYPKRIIHQLEDGGAPLTLEDLVAVDLVAEAIGLVLGPDAPTAAELPDAGRSAWLHQWCDSRGIPRPRYKEAVVQVVQEARRNRSVIEPAHLDYLRRLASMLQASLGIA